MNHPWFWRQDTKFPIITLLLLLLCSLTQSRLTLCDPIDCSMPSFPVLHCLLGFAQTLVHWVDNAIQLSHPLCPLLLLLSIFSASGSFPMCIQGWFLLGLTGLTSLLSKGLSRVFSSTTIQKHQFFSSAFFMVQLSYTYMTTGKTIAVTRWTFVGKVMSLLFNMLSRFVTAFLPRSKRLNFMAAVTVYSDF